MVRPGFPKARGAMAGLDERRCNVPVPAVLKRCRPVLLFLPGVEELRNRVKKDGIEYFNKLVLLYIPVILLLSRDILLIRK